MQSIFAFANEFPLVMAPASLIAGMLVISLIKAVFQLTERAFRIMAISVMLALTGGAVILLFID